MSIEIGILIAVVNVALSIGTFFVGRQSAARKAGENEGALNVTLTHLSDDVKEIKAALKIQGENYSQLHTDIEVLKRDLKTAFNIIDTISGKH